MSSASSGPTVQQTEIVTLVVPNIATAVTLFRLFVRMRQRRMWLDDAWVALAVVMNTIFFVVNYLYLHNFEEYPQESKVALYYMVVQFFCAIPWASRISILFTVVRLTGPASSLRKMLMFVFAAFLVTWMILFAQAFWTCEAEPNWKSEPRPQCDLGTGVAVAQIITDVVADTILIIVPCQLVYRVKLNRTQKIRIICIFSASAITTIVCVTHSYYVFSHGGLKEAMAALFETSVALIVANLSVVVAYFFRISTDESSTFSPKELKSIITFGSQPIRIRAQLDPLQSHTMVGVQTTTVVLDDFGSSVRKGLEDGDTEALMHVSPKRHLVPDT